MRYVLPVAVAAAAATIAGCLAACTGGSPQASGSTSAAAPGASSVDSRLSWHSCTAQGANLQCASLQVPLDYSHPNGRKITLALSRVPATAPANERQGVLLVNPGGPGGPGLSLAASVAQGLDPNVASEYEIIGFDTRGVGASVPSLSCEPSFFSGDRPDYIPTSAAEEQQNIDRAKAYAADCEKKFGWLLPYMTTENIARDMDSIRAALGQQKISYFAYSYGTYIGQVYATLFPHRLRRMVLDSTVDPEGAWWTDNIDQDYAFQGRQNAFYAWVAKYDNVYGLGSTAAQVSRNWYAARADLEANPIPGPSGRPLIGPDEWDDTFLIGGYDNGFWPDLASAFAAYLHNHSTSQVVALYDQEGVQNENEFAVYNAVECADVNWPRSWATWNSVNRTVFTTAPFEAWGNAWFNAACAFWPVKGPAQPLQIKGQGLPGILMLQGTLDPATPYAGAQVAHRLLPSARMVVVEGGGNHGQSLADPPNTCVNNYLNQYLATGALPEHPGLVNATCPALPDPTPNS
jgi:pimeloyl-ACP methyl ester carboxylesterase